MVRSPFALVIFLLVSPSAADDGDRVLSLDHYVRVRSTVPAIAGQTTQIYVREVVRAASALRGETGADRVVVFVHGAGTPAEVAFDVHYQDYSWMTYLAHAGFDVFAMDMTGYGRSTRPAAMNDPCNLSRDQQTAFVPALLPVPCEPTYSNNMTTIASDWNDIGAVVDHVRSLRHLERVDLIGWSLGGPRVAGYASRNPEKVQSIVLLSPAYGRMGRVEPPAQAPASGAAMNTQSLDDFNANWDRQVGCSDQVDPGARKAVWSQMLESDPIGATWGSGVRRAPLVTSWGWNAAVASKLMAPTLLVSPALDKQVLPERVRELHADLGARSKVLVDLACSSHNALWERNHLLLFKASLDWLKTHSVNGAKDGIVRVGY
jgi:pimeloyl-ACP methyl ester carboxylesterase